MNEYERMLALTGQMPGFDNYVAVPLLTSEELFAADSNTLACMQEQLFAEYLMEADLLPSEVLICETPKELPPRFGVAHYAWPKQGFVYCISKLSDGRYGTGWVQPKPRWWK